MRVSMEGLFVQHLVPDCRMDNVGGKITNAMHSFFVGLFAYLILLELFAGGEKMRAADTPTSVTLVVDSSPQANAAAMALSEERARKAEAMGDVPGLVAALND